MGDRIVDLLIKGMERLGAVFSALWKRRKRQTGAEARLRFLCRSLAGVKAGGPLHILRVRCRLPRGPPGCPSFVP